MTISKLCHIGDQSRTNRDVRNNDIRLYKQRHLSTPVFDSLVFDGFIGKVARGLIWKLSDDAVQGFVIAARGWGSRAPGRRWACSGQDHSWSKGARHQCPDEAPGAQRGQWPPSSDFASFLLLLLTYVTPDIHAPLFNPLLHALFYCKASNYMYQEGV